MATRFLDRPSTRYISHSGRDLSSGREPSRATSSCNCVVVARRRQRRAADVVGDVEVAVVDPHRTRQPQRHLADLLAVAGNLRQPPLDRGQQRLVAQAAARACAGSTASPRTSAWRCSPAGRTTRPMLTTGPPSSRHPPVRSVPQRRAASGEHGNRTACQGACRVHTRGPEMCHHLGVHTCHSPAGADSRRLPRRAEHDRDTRRRLRAERAGRRTAAARGAREPTMPAGICMPCAPARRSLRSVPPRSHVRRCRAAMCPGGDRPPPARHTVAADAVHRTHRLSGLLRQCGARTAGWRGVAAGAAAGERSR